MIGQYYESVDRIEPARLDGLPVAVADIAAELAATAAGLRSRLHPATATNLAYVVQIASAYHSYLIEGTIVRPRDIDLALKEQLAAEQATCTLQIEAAANARVQAVSGASS